MKRILILLLITTVLFMSGCETFRGMGKDVESVGEWVQDKVN